MRKSSWVVSARCWACVLVLGLGLVAETAGAQVRGVRFEITQVGDTTFRSLMDHLDSGLMGTLPPEPTTPPDPLVDGCTVWSHSTRSVAIV